MGLLVAVSGMTGCNNACQQLCGTMANYAEDCELPVSESEIDTCVEQQAEAPSEDLKTCRQTGSAEDIRNSWSCETLAEYWAGGGTVPPPPEE
jgi:hypothetical protein